MAKKGSGNWKPYKDPGPGVLVGNPLMSGQMPADNLEKREREKFKVPPRDVKPNTPIGGGSDKPNTKLPKRDEK